MKLIVTGYAAMIDDKIAMTSLGKDGYTNFYSQSEIKRFKSSGNYRPIIYPTEKGAKSAIAHELTYCPYTNMSEEQLKQIKEKARVIPITATYEINKSGLD